MVWAVMGPSDGRPQHREVLPSAWGREVDRDGSDRIGWARRFAADEAPTAGSELVVVAAFHGGEVPAAVLAWFRREFPDAVVRVDAASG